MVDITNQYWAVGDTNPTTQVWSGPTGAFVANTDATFEAWLNAADGRAPQMQGGIVIGTADNGAGAIRVQTNGGVFSTGQVMNFVGNNSGAAGASPITAIDSTHFDIVGSTFTIADTSGIVWAATNIDTFVDLTLVINTYNDSLTPQGYLAVTSSVNYVLANTPPHVLDVNMTAPGLRVTLPLMNVPGALPLGSQFYIHNAGSNNFAVRSFSDDVGHILVSAIRPGEYFTFFLSDNSTQNGTLFGRRTPGLPLSTIYGGLGFNASGATAGQIPVSDGGTDPLGLGRFVNQTVSGDASLAPTGALTVTGSGGVPFGPFATASAPLAIIYGGTQTSVAPAAGQLLIAQSASLYSPQSLVGGATLAASGTVILATPAATQRGGVFSHASVASQFLVSLDTSGSLTGAQPAFSNLTGVASIAQGGTNQTAAPAPGQILIAQSTSAFAPMSLSGGATLGAGGTVTLGTPGTAVLGGVFSFASVSHQFLTSLATSGSLAAAQPVSTDLSDTTAPTSYSPTDQSGASPALTFTNVSVQQAKYGNFVYVYGRINYPVTADTNNAAISVPVAVPNQQYAILPALVTSPVGNIEIVAIANTSTAGFFNTTTAVQYTNAQLSNRLIRFLLIYPAS